MDVSHYLVHLLSEKESQSVVLKCEILEVELLLEYNWKESFHSSEDMLIHLFIEQQVQYTNKKQTLLKKNLIALKSRVKKKVSSDIPIKTYYV